MTYMKKRIYLIAGTMFVLFLVIIFLKNQADAVTSTITSATAVATSTRASMTPGASTTTLSWADLNEGASVFISGTSSSTRTKFDIWFEASNNSIDWYSVAFLGTSPQTLNSTSTVLNFATTTQVYRWHPDSLVSSTSAITLPFPTIVSKWKRVNVAIPTGVSSENGAVYIEKASGIISK